MAVLCKMMPGVKNRTVTWGRTVVSTKKLANEQRQVARLSLFQIIEPSLLLLQLLLLVSLLSMRQRNHSVIQATYRQIRTRTKVWLVLDWKFLVLRPWTCTADLNTFH